MGFRVLLIFPPYFRLLGEKRSWYPLGLGSLAASLSHHGFEAYVHNCDAEYTDQETVISYKDKFYKSHQIFEKIRDSEYYVWSELERVLNKAMPSVVGIYVLTEMLPSVRKIVDICRAFSRHIPIVFGGPHTYVGYEDLISGDDNCFVLLGEGEHNFLKLVQTIKEGNIEKLSDIPGLVYTRAGEIQKSEISYPTIPDVDTLPFPSPGNLLDLDGGQNRIKKAMISASRGCPFRCAFCYKNIQHTKLRLRSSNSLVNEIKHYVEDHGIKKFYFIDDTFGIDYGNLREFCECLIREGLEIEWSCMTHTRIVDKERLILMSQAGCTSIHIGVESGSQSILDILGKGTRIPDIVEKCNLIKSYGIKLKTFFMVGIPFEKAEDIEKSKKLMKELAPYEVILQIYVPYPNTELHQKINTEICNIERFYDWETFHKSKINYDMFKFIDRETLDDAISDLFEYVESVNTSNGVY